MVGCPCWVGMRGGDYTRGRLHGIAPTFFMEIISCSDATQKINVIRRQQAELVDVIRHIQNPTTPQHEITQLVSSAKDTKQQLETNIQELELLLNPFEHRLNLKQQYEFQINLLTQCGLLETFASGEQGITGIDGKEYPIPSYREITRRMREEQEKFETKTQQGFVKLILVPFGLPLVWLTDAYRQMLQQHFDEGKLFRTQKTRHNPEEHIDPPIRITKLNDEGSLTISNEFNNADVNGRLIYHPTKFSRENHGGLTKHAYLNKNGGWSILLLEDMPNIPRQGNALTIYNRTQIEAEGTTLKKYIQQGKVLPNSREYLDMISSESRNPNSPYVHEQGITPEDHLLYAMTHLSRTNQVIDDYYGYGTESYLIGAYIPYFSNTPYTNWDNHNHRAALAGIHSEARFENFGIRLAVSV